MLAKFSIGDKAYIDGRCPGYIDSPRHRPRTIKAIEYDRVKRCSFYILGSNALGPCAGEPAAFGFRAYRYRSYQLTRWHTTGQAGHPRVKRPYHRKQGVQATGGGHQQLVDGK